MDGVVVGRIGRVRFRRIASEDVAISGIGVGAQPFSEAFCGSEVPREVAGAKVTTMKTSEADEKRTRANRQRERDGWEDYSGA